MKGSHLFQVVTARDYLDDLIAEATGSRSVKREDNAEYFADYIREQSGGATEEEVAELKEFFLVGAHGNSLGGRGEGSSCDLDRYFGEDGPAGRAARAAEEKAGALPAVEARLDGITVGQMMLYGIRGAYLYHRALAELVHEYASGPGKAI